MGIEEIISILVVIGISIYQFINSAEKNKKTQKASSSNVNDDEPESAQRPAAPSPQSHTATQTSTTIRELIEIAQRLKEQVEDQAKAQSQSQSSSQQQVLSPEEAHSDEFAYSTQSVKSASRKRHTQVTDELHIDEGGRSTADYDQTVAPAADAPKWRITADDAKRAVIYEAVFKRPEW